MSCKINECEKKAVARGLCSKHYAKWRKYGDPNTVKQTQFHGASLMERLLLRVEVTGTCWNWTGGASNKGYGQMRRPGTNVPALTHRVSWELAHGPIPAGAHVLHRCDNPLCVRPSHLFLGDHDDNMRDKMEKGRHRYGVSLGEKHGLSKLTAEEVLVIRSSGDTGVELARRYNVSPTTVSDIRKRRSWRHI